MTDIPEAAVTAAAEAIEYGDPEHWAQWRDAVARKALEAAAPHIAAAATGAERQRCAQLARQHHATIPADHPPGAQASFADYLRVTEGETPVSLYRKKPVIIEARQWLPGDPLRAGEVAGWLMVSGADFTHDTRSDGPAPMGDKTPLIIRTLEGDMRADPGDWIIRGVKGEFYPCKPDIFEATYEPAGETT